jgi:hypothetical protein
MIRDEMNLKHACAILSYHLPPFIPSARIIVRALSCVPSMNDSLEVARMARLLRLLRCGLTSVELPYTDPYVRSRG